MSEYCSICKENVDELWEGFDDCSKCTSQKKHNDRIKDLEWCEVGEHFVNKNEMWEDFADCMNCVSEKEYLEYINN